MLLVGPADKAPLRGAEAQVVAFLWARDVDFVIGTRHPTTLMCGIALGVWHNNDAQPHDAWASVIDQVRRRGLDSYDSVAYTQDDTRWELHASVLCLRGKEHTPQPITSKDGHLHLAWNGQIFSSEYENDSLLDMEKNDGAMIMTRLEEHAHQLPEVLVSALSAVDGPYAFVLLDTQNACVYYGRDPFGRRSLLHTTTQGAWLLASVSGAAWKTHWKEVDCDALWRVSLGQAPVRIPRHTPRFVLHAPCNDVPDHASLVPQLHAVLSESVRQRVQETRHARIGLLFSGGLDCTVLAALAAQHYAGPIDLINVSFENPRAVAAAWAAAEAPVKHETFPADPYAVPDRVTARDSYAQLVQLYPTHSFRLVQVNVPYTEYVSCLDTVQMLMYPQASVMDLSIAAALFFASRGEGYVDGVPYKTDARILLSGLGADELLAGYARHRQAWRRGSYDTLAKELQMDLDRISTRNLGRDDRVLSSHNREVRYPYLARKVVAFLASLPVQAKAYFEHDDLGDKYLLRCLAMHLGLTYAAQLPKRAIQFGTRSAKMDAAGAHAKGTAQAFSP